jgi:hypothetical protein
MVLLNPVGLLSPKANYIRIEPYVIGRDNLQHSREPTDKGGEFPDPTKRAESREEGGRGP